MLQYITLSHIHDETAYSKNNSFEQSQFVQDVTVIEPLEHSNNMFYKHYFFV